MMEEHPVIAEKRAQIERTKRDASNVMTQVQYNCDVIVRQLECEIEKFQAYLDRKEQNDG